MSFRQEAPLQIEPDSPWCRWGYLVLAHLLALVALILARLPLWHTVCLLVLLAGHGLWQYRRIIHEQKIEYLLWNEAAGWSLMIRGEAFPLLSISYLKLGPCLLLSCQMSEGHRLLFLSRRNQSPHLCYLLRNYPVRALDMGQGD